MSVLVHFGPSQTKSDLSTFSLSPDVSPNLCSSPIASSADCWSFTKMLVSSAYWDIFTSTLFMTRPCTLSDFLNLHANISTANTNKMPENGQPCLIPLVEGNHSEVKPLLTIDSSLFRYKTCTQRLKFSPKLNSERVLNMKECSIESKAAAKSRFMRIPGTSCLSQ